MDEGGEVVHQCFAEGGNGEGPLLGFSTDIFSEMGHVVAGGVVLHCEDPVEAVLAMDSG